MATIPGEPLPESVTAGCSIDTAAGSFSVAVLTADIGLSDFEIGDTVAFVLNNGSTQTEIAVAYSPFGPNTLITIFPAITNDDIAVGNPITVTSATGTAYSLGVPVSRDDPYDAETTHNWFRGTLETKQKVGHSEQLLICQRTGFKIKLEHGLLQEWNGRWIRRKSVEPRHPLDYIRASAGEGQRGSPRPEQADQDIADLYPSGVQASDLEP